mmetsp:Transcript_21532/g.83660  ORF Transcript_21532/g.83660 Transcript_21532/m.83660 type:complete len:662 (+) Transcript_21532:1047-3032(+)
MGQAHDALGHLVGRGGLAGDDDRARHPARVRVVADGLVAADHVQQVQQLALVFVDALDLDVEQAVEVHREAQLAADHAGQALLVGTLDGQELLAERRVGGQRLELGQGRQVLAPALADAAVQQRRQRRIGLLQPAPRRHAVGDVVEALRPDAGVVGKDGLHHQFRVQRRHAVDPVRGDQGQRGHAHAAFAMTMAALVDQRDARGQRVVTREAQLELLEEAVVDLVNDLEMARQQLLEHPHRPGLQRLGHQGVIGVGHGLAGDLPGLVPAQALLVQQQPHQLGGRQRGVGVIQVDGVRLAQVVQRAEFTQMARHQVLQRGADQEGLLLQAQLAAGLGRVVRVEHPVQRIGQHLVARGAGVVAVAEGLEGNRRGGGLPLAQCRHALAVVGRHDEVKGLGFDLLGRLPAAHARGIDLDATAETDQVAQVMARQLPGRRVAGPVVRLLQLAALLDDLGKGAIAVAQAVAEGRQFQLGERIQEAGGQPAQPAVAQSGIGLALEHIAQRGAMLGQPGLQRTGQLQGGQRVRQRPAHQELHRQIVHATHRGLVAPLSVGGLGGGPAARQRLAAGYRGGMQRGLRRGTVAGLGQLALIGHLEGGAQRLVGGGEGSRLLHRGGGLGAGLALNGGSGWGVHQCRPQATGAKMLLDRQRRPKYRTAPSPCVV